MKYVVLMNTNNGEQFYVGIKEDFENISLILGNNTCYVDIFDSIEEAEKHWGKEGYVGRIFQIYRLTHHLKTHLTRFHIGKIFQIALSTDFTQQKQ